MTPQVTSRHILRYAKSPNMYSMKYMEISEENFHVGNCVGAYCSNTNTIISVCDILPSTKIFFSYIPNNRMSNLHLLVSCSIGPSDHADCNFHSTSTTPRPYFPSSEDALCSSFHNLSWPSKLQNKRTMLVKAVNLPRLTVSGHTLFTFPFVGNCINLWRILGKSSGHVAKNTTLSISQTDH